MEGNRANPQGRQKGQDLQGVLSGVRHWPWAVPGYHSSWSSYERSSLRKTTHLAVSESTQALLPFIDVLLHLDCTFLSCLALLDTRILPREQTRNMAEPEVATKAPESDATAAAAATEPVITSDTPAQKGATMGEHCVTDRPTR